MADQSIPMFLRSALATGDLIYRAASSTWQRLGIGATDTIFSVASGIPAWQSLATLFANAFSNTRGAMLRRGSSAWEAFTGSQGGVLIRDANDATWLAKPSEPSLFYHAGTASNPAWKAFQTIIKASDENCGTSGGNGQHTTSGATMTKDNELVCALKSGKTYQFEVLVQCNINATPDMKSDMNFTGGTPTNYSEMATAMNIGLFQPTHTTSIGTDGVWTIGSTAHHIIWYFGRITANADGNLEFRWAQNSGSATLITVYSGSILRVWEAM